ncbi:MAG TPA: ABC transporter substrate-binding protein, partial [Candidatus Lustribacter sp.]
FPERRPPMPHRAVVAAFTLCIAALIARPLGAADAVAPVEINAILSETGGAAAIGTREALMLGIAEKTINKAGGIHGRPVKFSIQDDGTNPQTGVQLMNGLIARKVQFVVGSGITPICGAMLPLIAQAGPLDYCLSPIIPLTAGSYMFGASAGPKDILTYTLRFMHSRGWTKIGLITATDASGQAYDKEFDAALERPEGAGMQLVDREHFNNTDISVAAQVAKLKAAAPNVLLTYCVGPCFGTLLKAISDAGLALPVIGSGGNLDRAQLDSYKSFVPKGLYLVNYNGVTPDPAASGAYRSAQKRFFDAYAAAGTPVQALDVVAWDPVMLLVDALRTLGPDATAQQFRAYLAGLRGWAGLEGTYDFRAVPQRGLDAGAVRAYAWNAAHSTVTAEPAFRP